MPAWPIRCLLPWQPGVGMAPARGRKGQRGLRSAELRPEKSAGVIPATWSRGSRRALSLLRRLLLVPLQPDTYIIRRVQNSHTTHPITGPCAQATRSMPSRSVMNNCFSLEQLWVKVSWIITVLSLQHYRHGVERLTVLICRTVIENRGLLVIKYIPYSIFQIFHTRLSYQCWRYKGNVTCVV